MRERLKDIFDVLRANFGLRTLFSSAFSAFIGIVFALYNGFVGLLFRSVWNIGIGAYYCCLAVIRVRFLRTLRREESRFGTRFLFLCVNVALIVPLVLMVRGRRVCRVGLIPAIGMAVYTLYRVVMVILQNYRARRYGDALVRELRRLSIIDTAVAVLTLQNTLIMVIEGGVTGSMRVLSIISSVAIWLYIVVLSCLSVREGGL